MIAFDLGTVGRRTFLAGAAATGVLALSGCNSMGGIPASLALDASRL